MPTWSIVEGDMKAIMNRFEKLDNKISHLQICVNKGMAATAIKQAAGPSSSTVSAANATAATCRTTKPQLAGPSPAGQDVNVPNFLNELHFPPLNGRWEDDFTSEESVVHDDDTDCIWEDVPRRRRKKPRRSSSQLLNEVAVGVLNAQQLSRPDQHIVNSNAENVRNAKDRGQRSSRPQYAAMASAPSTATNHRKPSRQLSAPVQMLVGKKQDTLIKAAKPYVGKSVYCIDNVMTTVSEEDVTRFVSKLGITVLSCHRVKPRRSNWQRQQGIEPDRGTFRLCIPREENDRLLRADAWPAHIAVTPWRFAKKKTEVTNEDGDIRDNTTSRQQPSSLQRQSLNSMSALGAVGGTVTMSSVGTAASDNDGAAAVLQSTDTSDKATYGRFDVLRSTSSNHSDSAEEMNETVVNLNGC